MSGRSRGTAERNDSLQDETSGASLRDTQGRAQAIGSTSSVVGDMHQIRIPDTSPIFPMVLLDRLHYTPSPVFVLGGPVVDPQRSQSPALLPRVGDAPLRILVVDDDELDRL